jgi:hypothetical protein
MTQAAVLGANASIMSTPVGTAPGYMARAWVNFNGTSTVAIRASGNVSSITDNGTGDYTINFTTALTDANYAMAGTSLLQAGVIGVVNENLVTANKTTTTYRIATVNTVTQGFADMSVVQVAIFR